MPYSKKEYEELEIVIPCRYKLNKKKTTYLKAFTHWNLLKTGTPFIPALVGKKRWHVRKIPGILNYVYWLGKPAIIKEEEIITIKKFLNEFHDVVVEKRELVVNSTVRITQGVLMNYEGMVIEVFGNRAVVKIDTLDIQLSAHFDKKNLELLG